MSHDFMFMFLITTSLVLGGGGLPGYVSSRYEEVNVNLHLEHVLLCGSAVGDVGDIADGAVGLHSQDLDRHGHRLPRQHHRV